MALDGYHKLTVSLTGTRLEREEFLECSLICKLCYCLQISSGSKVDTGIQVEGITGLFSITNFFQQLFQPAIRIIYFLHGERVMTAFKLFSLYKSVPLQAGSGSEGSRKLRFPHFMTTAQGGGKVVSLTYRPHLPPGNSPGTHFC